MGRKNQTKRLNKYKYNFQQYVTIRSFDERIYKSKITIDELEIHRSNLLENVVEFINKSRPKNKEGKAKKEII